MCQSMSTKSQMPRRSKRLAAKKLRDLQKPKIPVIVPKPSIRSKKVKANKNRKPSRRPKALRLRPLQPYRKYVKRRCLWSLFTPCHETPGPDFETRGYSSKQHTAVCKGKEVFIQKLTQIVSGEAHQFDFYDHTFGNANLGQQYVDDEVAERILILQGAWHSYRANTVARMISMGKIPDVRKGIKLQDHFEHKIRKMSLFHQQRYLHWRLTMKGRQMDIKRNTANNLKSQYPVREQDEEGKTVKEVEPEMKAVMAYYTKEVCKDVENGESEGSLEF